MLDSCMGLAHITWCITTGVLSFGHTQTRPEVLPDGQHQLQTDIPQHVCHIVDTLCLWCLDVLSYGDKLEDQHGAVHEHQKPFCLFAEV